MPMPYNIVASSPFQVKKSWVIPRSLRYLTVTIPKDLITRFTVIWCAVKNCSGVGQRCKNSGNTVFTGFLPVWFSMITPTKCCQAPEICCCTIRSSRKGLVIQAHLIINNDSTASLGKSMIMPDLTAPFSWHH